MRLLLKLATLSAADLALLCRALGALWVVRLALWTMPFPRLKARLQKISPRRRVHFSTSISPAQISRALRRMSRCVPRASCLVLALAAHWLLRRENWGCDLHVGVVKDRNGQFLAHAWVECAGETVIGGGEAERYTPILRWDGS